MTFASEIETDKRHRILAWTSRPLQYAAKGEQRTYVQQLRSALADLVPTGELTAVLETAAAGTFDVENVLLYNVGTAAFGTLCTQGLSFIRRRGSPQFTPAASVTQAWPVLTHYQTGSRPLLLSRSEPHLCFHFEVSHLNTSTKAHVVWVAARAAVGRSSAKPLEATRFGLRLSVQSALAPTNSSTIGALKPLLDGVISALHKHIDDPSTALAIERLDDLCTAGTGRVRQLLASPVAVLPARRLVKPFSSTGVQWNPADDLCDVVEANWTTRDAPEARTRCTVELYPLGTLAEGK